MKKNDIINNLYPIIFALNNMDSIDNIGPNEESLNDIRKSLEKFYLDVQKIEVKTKEPTILRSFQINRGRLVECNRFDYINYVKGETIYFIKQVSVFRFEIGRMTFIRYLFYEVETGTFFLSDMIRTNGGIDEGNERININVCNVDNPAQKEMMREFISTNFQGRMFGIYNDTTCEFVSTDEPDIDWESFEETPPPEPIEISEF